MTSWVFAGLLAELVAEKMRRWDVAAPLAVRVEKK
jgi:hypothetical protein